MHSLYLWLNLGSFVAPFLASFIPKFKRLISWRNYAIATSIVTAIFIIWDVIFTEKGYWGFNPDYILGYYVLSLPIEEWMFFLMIPFSSLSINYVIQHYYPNFKLKLNTTKFLSYGILGTLIVVLILNFGKAYTTVNYIFLILLLTYAITQTPELLQRFYLTFLIILIPFTLVNGALTGMFTPSPVVWYDDSQNLGIRFITIPIEDFGYAFNMLFLNVLIQSKLKKS